MPESPLVTVITTVYNGAAFLAEAIESVRAQTHRPVEHLIVDDGSTDGSADVARRYGDAVRLFTQPNRGISVARNLAFEQSRGSLIAHLDADDRLRPDVLERAVACLSDPDIGAAFFDMVEFVSPGVDPERFADRDVGRVHEARLPNSMVVRRSVAEQVGPYEESLIRAEGLDWTARLLHLGVPCIRVGAVGTERRLHADNHGARRSDAVVDYVRMARRHIHRQRAGGDG